MAEIANSVATEILNKLLTVAANELSLAWGFKSELKSLQKRMQMVLAFLADVEGKPSAFVEGAAVQLWFKEMKDVVYDTDAVLDEFQYEQLRRKIEVQGQFKSKVTDFFSLSKNPLAFRLKLAHKIRNINLMLDGINKRASDLGLQQAATSNTYAVTRREIDVPRWGGDLQKVVGRDNEVSIIVEKLLSPENEESLTVFCIVGMAGQGKTTLAHLVCENEKVVRYFDKIIKVSVSDDFEETRILNDMVQHLRLTESRLSNKYAIIDKLKEDLKDKRFMLLLDDIWNEDANKWKSLKNALLDIHALIGSKIIVTTRSMAVAKIMQSSPPMELGILSQKDSWTLFERKAFAEGGAPKSPELVEIGQEVVKRCNGVPLVIDVIGGVLYSKKSKEEWLSVKENSMWGSIKDVNDLAINVLKLSYDHLSPSHLKHCFTFLSIFPKDSNIRQDSVVQMWVALGLLPNNNNLELEDVGNLCFDALLGKSLLQGPKIDEDTYVKQCKMHDLVHDLAQRTSGGYCLGLASGDEVSAIGDDVIYLSLSSSFGETLERVGTRSFKRLQTLILEGCVLDNFENLELLRVLVLVGDAIVELPVSVGKLKHLRYLDVSRTKIEKLPTSVTKLYNLQTLAVNDSGVEFPKGLGNLINLRHLYGGGIFIGVGQLTELQTLQVFTVSREQGCLIGELGGLNKLKGKLRIKGLKHVETLDEAKSAKLSEKLNIKSLIFEWRLLDWPWLSQDEEPSRGEEDVLEGLRPHSNLRSLKIYAYKGSKLASWMMSESVSALNNLVDVALWGCSRCEQVPTLGQLPNLKKVFIDGLRNVRRIGAEFYGNGVLGRVDVFFPVLTELALKNMSELEEWVDVKDKFPSYTKKQQLPCQFPKLQKFEIFNCPKLIELPMGSFEDFVDIRELRIGRCQNMRVIPDITGLQTLTRLYVSFFGKSITELPRGIETLTSLHTLIISRFPGVVSVPELGGLARLEELTIGEFSEDLDEFPWPYNCSSSSTSSSSSSLQTLNLRGWANVLHLPQQVQHLSALTNLSLISFDGLESLPEWLGNLSSLQSLFIHSCKILKSMPSEKAMHRLTKLQLLSIDDCPVLKERCVKGSGTEWHKIQHIPYINIHNTTIQDNRV